MNTDEMKNTLFRWASSINVVYILRFHDFVVGELQERESAIKESLKYFQGTKQERAELLLQINLYGSIYKYHLMNNTFLVLYSHLEEWLYLIWKSYGKNVALNSKARGSISRFKPVLQDIVKLDLSRDTKWRFISDAEKVRNCLLHANGRTDLSKDAKELETLVAKSKGQLRHANSRVSVDQQYIERFFECIQYIIYKVTSQQQQGNCSIVEGCYGPDLEDPRHS